MDSNEQNESDLFSNPFRKSVYSFNQQQLSQVREKQMANIAKARWEHINLSMQFGGAAVLMLIAEVGMLFNCVLGWEVHEQINLLATALLLPLISYVGWASIALVLIMVRSWQSKTVRTTSTSGSSGSPASPATSHTMTMTGTNSAEYLITEKDGKRSSSFSSPTLPQIAVINQTTPPLRSQRAFLVPKSAERASSRPGTGNSRPGTGNSRPNTGSGRVTVQIPDEELATMTPTYKVPSRIQEIVILRTTQTAIDVGQPNNSFLETDASPGYEKKDSDSDYSSATTAV